jgi:hypothetical protein
MQSFQLLQRYLLVFHFGLCEIWNFTEGTGTRHETQVLLTWSCSYLTDQICSRIPCPHIQVLKQLLCSVGSWRWLTKRPISSMEVCLTEWGLTLQSVQRDPVESNHTWPQTGGDRLLLRHKHQFYEENIATKSPKEIFGSAKFLARLGPSDAPGPSNSAWKSTTGGSSEIWGGRRILVLYRK